MFRSNDVFPKRIPHHAVSVTVLSAWLSLLTVLSAAEPKFPEQREIEDHFRGHYQAGIILGVVVDGREAVYSLGTKEKGEVSPIDRFTTFEIGSITKTFTATVLADLELKGLIDRQTDFIRYFPPARRAELDQRCRGITLHHLVTHTSGIPAMPANLGDIREDPALLESYGVPQLVEFLGHCTLDFPPGTTHRYSNLGVSILGYALARATGTSYEDLLQIRIFDPLGMKRSSLRLTAEQRRNMALGHDRTGEREPYWNASEVFQGSGFIKSCLHDMLIYLRTAMGIEKNALTPAATRAVTPIAPGYPDSEICMAWYREKIAENLHIVCHNGSTGGFYAFIGFTDSRRFGLVLLANSKITRELESRVYDLFRTHGAQP